MELNIPFCLERKEIKLCCYKDLIDLFGFAFQPFQPTPAPVPIPLAGWMSNPSTVTHPAASEGGAIGLGAPSITGKISFCYY